MIDNYVYKRLLSDRVFSDFKTNVDSIMSYRALFPNAKAKEIDVYLAKIRYYQRFGQSLEDAREKAFFNEVTHY
jgi:hypothetical protein